MSDNDCVSRAWLLAEYDRQHEGSAGKARKLIEDAPAVPHEITAVEYLQTMRSICENGRNCGKRPLSYHNNGASINCQDYAAYYPEKAVAIVERWKREHPQKEGLK